LNRRELIVSLHQVAHATEAQRQAMPRWRFITRYRLRVIVETTHSLLCWIDRYLDKEPPNDPRLS